MHSAAQRLTPEQMQALADYYASLPAKVAGALDQPAPTLTEPSAQTPLPQKQR